MEPGAVVGKMMTMIGTAVDRNLVALVVLVDGDLQFDILAERLENYGESSDSGIFGSP